MTTREQAQWLIAWKWARRESGDPASLSVALPGVRVGVRAVAYRALCEARYYPARGKCARKQAVGRAIRLLDEAPE